MSHQIKDIDYLSISTRIRAMENRLLTRERMDRMIDARENGEAMKILTECGYPEDRGGGLEGVLAQARADTFRDIAGAVPESCWRDGGERSSRAVQRSSSGLWPKHGPF